MIIYVNVFEVIYVISLQAYLEKYKYANAKTKDLWDVLTNSSTEVIISNFKFLF